MAKRNATTELTHDNWDQEEESEEAGTFKQVRKLFLFFTIFFRYRPHVDAALFNGKG
jgi:hypothetical protein